MKHSRKTYSDEGCTLFVLCNRHKKSGFAPRTGKLEEKLAGAGLFGYMAAAQKRQLQRNAVCK